MKLNTLVNILKQEQEIHHSMLSVKKEEQQAIALGNTDAVFHAAERLNRLADEAAALERERRLISRAIAEELSLESEEIRLSDLLTHLEPYNRIELESAGKALLDTVVALQRQNQTNAQMLQRSMNALNEEITRLVKPEESGVYTAQGNRKKAPPTRVGLNLRV